MRFLGYLLFQLDEARRYIEDGRPEHLRLAFLLLDNAAEIQMVRRIKTYNTTILRRRLGTTHFLLQARARCRRPSKN